MKRARLISFLRKWWLYPRSSRKFISSLRLLKKSSAEQMRRGRKARLSVSRMAASF